VSSTDVVVCTWSGSEDGLPGEVEDVLTLGRKVAAALGGELAWLVLGPTSEQTEQTAGRYGVAGVDRIDDAALAEFRADFYVEALAQYCAERSPRVVLFGQNFDVRLIAPRLAGRAGAAVVMNGVDIAADGSGNLEVTASAYGGDTRAVYAVGAEHPCVVSVLPNAVQPEPVEGEGTAPAVRDVAVDLSGVAERIRVVERAHLEGPRLEGAEVIVAGGRGLGAPENYKLVEELAAALGGLPGASRPIVDDGWVDSSHQVGLTGKITRPGLYVAAGISGASQHMAGCSAAKTIVAINTDADASIFRYARFGVVGDCVEILPELIRAAKER
jgi:electron transfer flavoprotein alpha subunit